MIHIRAQDQAKGMRHITLNGSQSRASSAESSVSIRYSLSTDKRPGRTTRAARICPDKVTSKDSGAAPMVASSWKRNRNGHRAR